MGVVYLARDPFIEREVAIKLLRAIDDDDAQERFQREIRIAGALSHPNIVRIYDAGTHDSQPFVAMEYVNGQTLSEVIKAGVPLELDRKIEMLLDLADGLGYAHKRGVIHRDIKPSNLIIDDHGALKILDFGIARLSDAGRTSLSAVGTPSYMAPEQILGETVDARCDLFSFGVVVYEVVAYRQPFTGDTEHSVYHKILNTQPRPLTEVAPGTPPSFDVFMRTALAKRPEERFQTAKALGDELRAIRGALTADETIVVARPKPRSSGSQATPLSGSPLPAATPLSGAPPPPPPTAAGITGTAQRSPASRRLADLRERQLAAAKDEARRALAEGRPQEAMEAAERALVLDEEDAAAHELAELARQAIERIEARRAIAQAEQHLHDGQLTLARQVVEHARTQAPHDAELAGLDQRLAQMQRDRESAAQRSAQLREAIEHARRSFELGDLDTALASIGRALGVDPENAQARELKTAVEAAQRTRKVEAEWHDAARQACARAREVAGRGQVAEAIGLLDRFTPPHPIVTGLAGELRTRQALLAEEQRRHQLEAQRAQQRARGVEQASRLIAGHDPDGALRVLAELRTAGIFDDELVALEQRATDLRLAVAQQRRRDAMLARGIETARTLLASHDADAALLAIEQLEADGLANDALAALKREALALQERLERDRQQQLDRERRASRLADGLAEVKGALSRRDADAALAALALLRRDGLDVPELKGLEATAQALKQELARERQQQIERDRRASRLTAGLADVRQALGQRDADAALAALGLLRRDGFDAPDLATLEAEAKALQQQVARERQEQIEQQRRGTRLARGVAEIKNALEKRDADAAAAALALLEREGFGGAELAPHAREVRALQEQIEKERREQIERDRRAARLARGLEDARLALQRRDPKAALDTLAALEKEKIDAPDIAALKKDAKALEKQLARERKEAAASAAATAAASGGLSSGEAAVGTEAWTPAASGPAGSKLPLLAGAGVLLVAVIGGGIWMATRSSEPAAPASEPAAQNQAAPASTDGAPGTTTTTPAETAPSTTAATETPAPPPSDGAPGDTGTATTSGTTTAGTSEVARLIGESVRLEQRGDLRDAARLLGEALRTAPRGSAEASSAGARLRSVVGRARQRAEQARERAEQANAVGNDDFLSAARTATGAQRLADRDPQQAVGQFLDAEAGFDRAREAAASASNRPVSQPGTGQQAGPVSPGRPTPVIPREVPGEAPPTSPSTPPAGDTRPRPTEPAPTTTPVSPPVPTGPDPAEQKAVEATVRRYFSARSSLNLAQVQQVYPGVPANRERDTLRSIERACETFSEEPTQITLVSVTGQEAIVRSRAKTTCRQRAGGRESDIPEVEVFITLRKNGGAWQISQVNRPDRVR